MIGIGEASRRSGVHIETIRYYEREGIVAPPARTAAGRRTYTEDEVATLTFIARSRELGFSLADIVALMKLRSVADDQCDEVRGIATGHLAAVRGRIGDLKRLESALADLLAECSAGRTQCPALRKLYDAVGVRFPATSPGRARGSRRRG